jgi:hypothetical protein
VRNPEPGVPAGNASIEIFARENVMHDATVPAGTLLVWWPTGRRYSRGRTHSNQAGSTYCTVPGYHEGIGMMVQEEDATRYSLFSYRAVIVQYQCSSSICRFVRCCSEFTTLDF